MAHALHPNYADKHDPDLAPRLGSGLVLKHNVNQRYATTSISATLFRSAVGGYKHHHTWVAGCTVAERCEASGMRLPPYPPNCSGGRTGLACNGGCKL